MGYKFEDYRDMDRPSRSAMFREKMAKAAKSTDTTTKGKEKMAKHVAKKFDKDSKENERI